MALAQSGQPPVSLAHAHARSIKTPPQLAYSLRSSGEEQIDIVPSIDGEDRENIGTINAPTAIREAYPGAIYRHNGRTYRVTKADPDATELVFYPAKALANDQLIRWKSAAEAANVYPESIQQITGDTPMRLREQLLNRATVALVTPDVVHAWPIRTARPPAQKRFLANLRIAVTDGAHVHEDVPGTNAACMFRRLGVATIQDGNRYFIQHNAATATIQSQ